jgi:PAS domain S-box-containing protein
VRSYLAVSVIAASGAVHGGLFFGHPEKAMFSERTERIVAAVAVQAGVAIDKALLYQAAQHEIERRKAVEADLRAAEEALESKVAIRTAELAAINAQLVAEAEHRKRIEGRFQLLVNGVTDYALYMIDPEGIITNWNTGAQRIKGYAASEVVGKHYRQFFTESDREAGLPEMALRTAAEVGRYEAEGQRVRKDGSVFWANVVLDAIRDESGELLGFAKITRDVTERRNAAEALQHSQEQLAQAQKMEGIGHLTGGVAHDFNNLLAIIMGNIETLQRSLQKPTVDRDRVENVAENAMRGVQRAAALTQRLLAFSRQQPLEPKVVHVARLVAGMADLVERSLGEQIAIETVFSGGLWNIHADPNQLEIAILNLALNARDAMPQGGKLHIEVANAFLDENYARHQSEVLEGQYVMVSVTDTGCGMSREVLARVFEPFFTTKDTGHGTGLGLSQVYGFVKQSGGHVKIYSEVGDGTSATIYLPRWHAVEQANDAPESAVAVPRGDGTQNILVVEDEANVRAQTIDMLHELGYRTLEASDGHMALRLLVHHPDVALLFTDVGLPGGMNGRQLADEVKVRHPDVRILFTTGYARNAIVHHGRLDPGVQLITKPFAFTTLASKVRSVLEASSGRRRILLVDDEQMLRIAVAELLTVSGFKVEAAGNVAEALALLNIHKGDISAAIVDVGLPDHGGDHLVAEIRTLYPSMPIIIGSGSDEAALRKTFGHYDKLAILIKPYGIDRLLKQLDALGVA